MNITNTIPTILPRLAKYIGFAEKKALNPFVLLFICCVLTIAHLSHLIVITIAINYLFWNLYYFTIRNSFPKYWLKILNENKKSILTNTQFNSLIVLKDILDYIAVININCALNKEDLNYNDISIKLNRRAYYDLLFLFEFNTKPLMINGIKVDFLDNGDTVCVEYNGQIFLNYISNR